MTETLLDRARRRANSNTDRHGVAMTPVDGLVVLRATSLMRRNGL